MLRLRLSSFVIIIVLLVPNVSLCWDNSQTGTARLTTAFSTLTTLLMKLKNHSTAYANIDLSKLLAAIELLKKNLKKLAIDQEDFINSISLETPDLYRVNNNINSLRGSIINVHDSIQVLQEILSEETELYPNNHLDKEIKSDLIDNQKDLDEFAQVLLFDNKAIFKVDQAKILKRESLLLKEINASQLAATEIYEQLEQRLRSNAQYEKKSHRRRKSPKQGAIKINDLTAQGGHFGTAISWSDNGNIILRIAGVSAY